MLVSLATDSARPDRDNEDFAAASANVAVLLDGAGTPGGAESGCVHGVAWFTRQLGAQLLAEASEDDERPLPECLRNAICHTRNLHAETCDLDHPGTPSATVIVVRLGPDNLEYLVLADSEKVSGCRSRSSCISFSVRCLKRGLTKISKGRFCANPL